MRHLEEWFLDWVPDPVFCGAGGRSSVGAWKTTALCVVGVLSCAVDGDVNTFAQVR